MSTGTPITVTGNLTAAPELRFTSNGTAVANLSIAVNHRRLDRSTGEWVDGDTSYYRCNVWREQAEQAAESLTRGTRVIVTGLLKTRTYETKDGEKRTAVEIDVDEIGPSLRFATASVTKITRSSGQLAAA